MNIVDSLSIIHISKKNEREFLLDDNCHYPLQLQGEGKCFFFRFFFFFV